MEYACLACSHQMDSQGRIVPSDEAFDGKLIPEDGDVSICISCGAIAIFLHGGLRLPSEEEIAVLSKNPVIVTARKTLRQVEAFRRTVQEVRRRGCPNCHLPVSKLSNGLECRRCSISWVWEA